MSATEELKNMLLTFRVSELQMLLGYAGQNKTGRKTELQARAISLIKNKAPSQTTHIISKIKELYRTIQQGGTVVAATPMMDMQPHHSQSATSAPPIITSALGPPMSLRPPPSIPSRFPGTPMQNIRPYDVHMKPNFEMEQQLAYPIQPDVTFKRLPFYDVLGELLKPSSLILNGGAREQVSNFYFYLTPQQASEIAINREIGPGTKNEYFVQVQMRFCLLETSCEQEDSYPPGLQIKVNGKSCQLPGTVSLTKPNGEPKRLPRPLNVSPLVKLCPSIANHVLVTWTPEYNRGYVIVVNLVRKLSAPDLLQRLKAKGARHADFTTGLIKEKLSEDADSEIATTSLRVSLLCPLGKMRMVTPCRPSTCLHLQCFDAFLYIQMNEKKPTWTCPVCDKQALYDNLVIDGYFQEVLSSQQLSSDSHEIQLHKDGSWSSHLNKKSIAALDTPTKQEPIEEIIDDMDDPNDSNSGDEGIGSEINSVSEGPIKTKDENKVTFVDLTVSDDEDADNNPPPTTKSDVSNQRPNHKTEHIDTSIITLDSPSPPMREQSPPSCALAQGDQQPSQQLSNLMSTTPQSHLLPGNETLPRHIFPSPPLPILEPNLNPPELFPSEDISHTNYSNYLRMDSRYHPY